MVENLIDDPKYKKNYHVAAWKQHQLHAVLNY